MSIAPWMPAAALLLAGWGGMPLQGSRVTDEGSFTITIAGRTAGRENFRISTITRGTATEFVARGDAAFGDRKVSSELHTDSSGGALEYTAKRTGAESETWHGLVTRGRLSAAITTPRGPAGREFIVPAGVLVLDEDLLHQTWFAARATAAGRAPVIVPRKNAQLVVSVSTVGEETVQVGSAELVATHIRIDEPSGARRDVWVDGSGRLLKVEIADRRLVALRDDPPR